MIIRDTLNTETGYQEIIDDTVETIQEDEQRIKELLKDEEMGITKYPNPNKEIIKSIKKGLLSHKRIIFESYYSLGKDISEIRQGIYEIIKCFQECWKSEWGYVQMTDTLSIGIMLDIEDKEFDKLVALVERDKIKDHLIDFLIRYKKPYWQQTENFLWNKPYKGIAEIVNLAEKDKEKALERLKKYLKEWYRAIEIKTHESKWNIHTGYWSWEAGAIAKILGLDDSSLKNQQYYPYDMVHFTDIVTT